MSERSLSGENARRSRRDTQQEVSVFWTWTHSRSFSVLKKKYSRSNASYGRMHGLRLNRWSQMKPQASSTRQGKSLTQIYADLLSRLTGKEKDSSTSICAVSGREGKRKTL